ncbi:MAG: 2'-5' RNA ligase family protein [Pseudoxanthomonas sp.]
MHSLTSAPVTQAGSPIWLDDALWHAGRGHNRLLFMARPHGAARTMFDTATREINIQTELGMKMFPLANWLQSLSERYVDTPDLRMRLLRAGDAIKAQAFTLELDRLKAEKNAHDLFNVEVRSARTSDALEQLIQRINDSIADQRLPRGEGHSPHVTLSYTYDRELGSRQLKIPAIAWTIDQFELVVGRGDPYRYQTLGRWALEPAPPHVCQAPLF